MKVSLATRSVDAKGPVSLEVAQVLAKTGKIVS
jgi:hypothetical protein